MIVDDSKDMRVLMRLLLEFEGYEIHEADDGKQALQKITKDKFVPDLIFLDHNMPVMNGPEFVDVFEKKYPDIFSRVPVIMLTAMEPQDVAEVHVTEIVNKIQGVHHLLQLANKYLK